MKTNMISAIINCMWKLPIIVMMCTEFWIRFWNVTLRPQSTFICSACNSIRSNSISVFSMQNIIFTFMAFLVFTILRHSKLNGTFFSLIFFMYSWKVDSNLFQQFSYSCVNDAISKDFCIHSTKALFSSLLSPLVPIWSLEFISFQMNGVKDRCNSKIADENDECYILW